MCTSCTLCHGDLQLYTGQRLRLLTNTFLPWANRHSSQLADDVWVCVCVRAERSGSVKECMFFGDVAVLWRSSVSVYVCACIQASAVVNEALLGLLIMFNQWWERQLWFLARRPLCFRRYKHCRSLQRRLIRGVSVALLSSDCVGVSLSVAQPLWLCQWGGAGEGSSKDEEKGVKRRQGDK